jgi:hypothetical protein
MDSGLWLTTDNDEGGIVMLSHPTNYNDPEPMRIWDKNKMEDAAMSLPASLLQKIKIGY